MTCCVTGNGKCLVFILGEVGIGFGAIAIGYLVPTVKQSITIDVSIDFEAELSRVSLPHLEYVMGRP